MRMTSRAALAAGLSLIGLVGLIGQTQGQQDQNVQKTNTSAPAPKTLPPAMIGSVDIEAVIKSYDKFKASSEAFKTDLLAKQGELNKLVADGKQAGEMLAKLSPGTPDYKKLESKITALKGQYQAMTEQAQSDFAQREADLFAMAYKDVQDMVGLVARQRRFTYVVRVSKAPISATEPESIQSAISRTVIYADPSTDVTNDVIYYLNSRYRASGGTPPKGTAGANEPAAAGTPAQTAGAAGRSGSTK